MIGRTFLSKKLRGDLMGGLASMLVVLPSSIAFGIILYAALGLSYAANGAIAAMIGTIVLGIIAPCFGGTPRLITAPCGPAAALLALFVEELVSQGTVPLSLIPFYVGFVSLLAGLMQFLAGCFTLGKFIKYIPYPVVAGYLNSVGILICVSQIAPFLGFPKGVTLLQGLREPSTWHLESVFIGSITIISMLLSQKFLKCIPSIFTALLFGIGSYLLLALFHPSILNPDDNALIIGRITSSVSETFFSALRDWSFIPSIKFDELISLLIPASTLAILLCIDSLKTCVILDVITKSRHNSNKELLAQGIANISSCLVGGIPGAGSTGPSIININSGAQTNLSGIFSGIFAAIVVFALIGFIPWIPLAALSGVLLIIGLRMLDKNSIQLLKHKSTVFDFFVILAVVISAVSMSLVFAAGVGVFLAIILFLREQIRSSVVRRKFLGSQKFSKKQRLNSELTLLQSEGKNTIIYELQGPLFFGTTDQLFTELEPNLDHSFFIVLDMHRVQSLDFTAANLLKQIHDRLKERNGYLILTSIPPTLPSGQNVKKYLSSLGFGEIDMNLKIYQDLDTALEWVEDKTISKYSEETKDASFTFSLHEFEFFTDLPRPLLDKIESVTEKKKFNPKDKIFSMGDESDEIYFLCKGTVKIDLPLGKELKHHLLTLSPGNFFGEMSFLDKGKRSADAVAINEVILYALSRTAFEKISKDSPEIAALFLERLAHTLSKRLRITNLELITIEAE